MSHPRFLHLQRPDIDQGIVEGQTDTTTLAAHDFDVDVRTGFMPPHPPLASLPPQWDLWEILLRDGINAHFPLNPEPTALSRTAYDWHLRVNSAPLLETRELLQGEPLLRRAHLVLAALVHIFVHSHPVTGLPPIPQSIGIPLLKISRDLQIPPVLTYSDTVLYNWELRDPTKPLSESNIRISPLLSSTPDEAHFYCTSALIELRGVKALDLMRSSMNEAFIGDSTAVRRITAYLIKLSGVIAELTNILSNIKTCCSPVTFYSEIRPWLRGSDARSGIDSLWTFENAEAFGFAQLGELSGPSAGQSSLIHALDIFLGIHKLTHTTTVRGQEKPFLERMKLYMPRHHRAFLNHLANEPQLRELVDSSQSPALASAYDETIRQMKLFRDQHIRIVTLYIIAPSHSLQGSPKTDEKGTGGTDVLPFLKSIRDHTQDSILNKCKLTP